VLLTRNSTGRLVLVPAHCARSCFPLIVWMNKEAWIASSQENKDVVDSSWAMAEFRLPTRQAQALRIFPLDDNSSGMLDTIVCSGPLVWLFSPAWDAVILILEVGFIYSYVAIDPTC
jgi:hypothetical protein